MLDTEGTMSTTMYPKSYVLERIAARRASLESKRTTDTAIVAREAADVVEKQQAYLDQIKAKVAGFVDRVNDTALGDNPAENYQIMSGITTPYFSTGRSVPGLGQAGTHANNRLKGYAREIDALDHTEAYLKDTPVDEFSLTSLKRLGLLEAIKFNLDDVVNKK